MMHSGFESYPAGAPGHSITLGRPGVPGKNQSVPGHGGELSVYSVRGRAGGGVCLSLVYLPGGLLPGAGRSAGIIWPFVTENDPVVWTHSPMSGTAIRPQAGCRFC